MVSTQSNSQLPGSTSTSAITLTDQVIESLKPALVFKNFVSEIDPS